MKKGEKSAWYKKVSNWLFLVVCLILVPVLVANLWIIIQSKTNQDKVPSVFGIKPFLVLSGSMESEIRKGDLIITQIVNPETLKVDDVVAFRDAAGTVTTHRIIDIVVKNGKSYFITKGDNNTTQDLNLVELSDVEGKYILRIPGIGSMMNSLAQPTTIIIIVFGITLVFIIGFAISNKKQSALEKQEFLEYKRLKELEESKNKETKETKSIKAVEDEELLEKEDEKEKHSSEKAKPDDKEA